MSKQLTEYHRKPWGGKFGYTPRLGWSIRTMYEEPLDGVFVRVQKLKDGQAIGLDGVIHRADLTRDTLAKQIKYARRMIRDHMRGPQ